MRTSLADHLLALKRPAAVAALGVAAAGSVALRAPALGLWTLRSRVQALDTVGTTTVATMVGADASPVAWVAAVGGGVVLAVAVLVALDRPPPHAEAVLAVTALLLVACTGLLALHRPTVGDFGAVARAAGMDAGDEVLPVGVDIALQVRPGVGLWLLTTAGPLIGVGTALVRRTG